MSGEHPISGRLKPRADRQAHLTFGIGQFRTVALAWLTRQEP